MFETPLDPQNAGPGGRPQSHLKKRKVQPIDTDLPLNGPADKSRNAKPNGDPGLAQTQPVVEPASSGDNEPLHATDKKGELMGSKGKIKIKN